jgi:hypothetical protein
VLPYTAAVAAATDDLAAATEATNAVTSGVFSNVLGAIKSFSQYSSVFGVVGTLFNVVNFFVGM